MKRSLDVLEVSVVYKSALSLHKAAGNPCVGVAPPAVAAAAASAGSVQLCLQIGVARYPVRGSRRRRCRRRSGVCMSGAAPVAVVRRPRLVLPADERDAGVVLTQSGVSAAGAPRVRWRADPAGSRVPRGG